MSNDEFLWLVAHPRVVVFWFGLCAGLLLLFAVAVRGRR